MATSFVRFTSLPAELRNDAYKQTLTCSEPVHLSYDDETGRFYTARTSSSNERASSSNNRTPLQALKLLSGLNHSIRQEAQSYFFASNFIELKTRQTFTTDPDYVLIYIKFLENIGEAARRSLRRLRLTVTGDSKQHRPTLAQATKLWNLLAECTNLERLDLFLDVEYFYIDQRKALHSYLSARGMPISGVWPLALESLKRLNNLKYLFLHITYSSRWRYIEADVSRPMSYPKVPLSSRKERFTFNIRRPIDEAARLADQIKGALRLALRRRGVVQVLPAETWDHSELDVVFAANPAKNSVSLLSYRRLQPQHRKFNYSNGFKSG